MSERRLRDRAAALLVGHRRLVLVVVLATVLVVSAGVVFVEEESGLHGEFDFGTEEEAKLDYVEANFSTTSDREYVQVIIREDNTLAKETLIGTLELQQEIRANESVAPTLADDQSTAGLANIVATAALRLEQRGVTGTATADGAMPGADKAVRDTGETTRDTGETTLEAQIDALQRLSQAEFEFILGQVLDEDGPAPEALEFVPNDYEYGTDADSTMVVAVQTVEEEYPVTAAPEQVVESHLAIEALAEESDLDAAVVGSGVLTDEEQRAMADTMALVGPAALLLVVLVLVVAYRDLVDVLLGLAGILLVLLWTFGALGWLGVPFNVLLVAVPVLLIGLSIDYCIHVFMRYREAREHGGTHASGRHQTGDRGDRDTNPGIDEAMTAGLAGVGAALVWVTVTTAIGFLSNLASPVGPVRELGLVAALGIVGAFVVFVLLLPPLKAELDAALERAGFDRGRRPLGAGGRVGRVLAVGSHAARRAPLVVLLVVVLVTGLATVAAVNVSTTWGPEDNMVEDAPAWTQQLPGDLQPGEYDASEQFQYANDNYIRPDSEAELLVEGGVTDPDTLERVAAARDRAAGQDAVATLASDQVRVTDPLTTMERVAEENETFAAAFAAADTTGDGVPDSDLAALYDALFEVTPEQADQVLHRADGEYRALRMAVSVDPGAEGGAMTDQLETVGEELDDDGVTVTVTGQPVLDHTIAQELLDTLLTSFAVTLVAVLAVLMAVFRAVHGSATLGAVTLVPVALAVSWVVGTMTMLGYPLSVLNVIIASLTIGIGIDYSIHVSERFREELDGKPVGEAVTTTVRGTGGALLGSAATTAIGFGVLMLAVHPPLQQFGTLTAIMIGYAFVGAVFVLPSLLVLWARHLHPAGRRADEPLADGEPTNAD